LHYSKLEGTLGQWNTLVTLPDAFDIATDMVNAAAELLLQQQQQQKAAGACSSSSDSSSSSDHTEQLRCWLVFLVEPCL
jgi:hypothetical protein